MKKILCLCLALMICCCAASAETLVCGSAESTYTSLAEAFAKEAGMELTSAEDEAAAANAMLADASVIGLLTQEAFIRGLQGYVSGELRTDMQSVAMLAEDDLYLVCAAETAGECGFDTLSGMLKYAEENEYELYMMRTMDASNADSAVFLLEERYWFDEELFFDEADILDNIASDLFIFVANTRQAKDFEAAGCVVLGTLSAARTAAYPEAECAADAGMEPIPGSYVGVFVNNSADASAVSAVVESVLASENWKTAVENANMHSPADADFAARVKNDFENYKEYMTSEGLFFYED